MWGTAGEMRETWWRWVESETPTDNSKNTGSLKVGDNY